LFPWFEGIKLKVEEEKCKFGVKMEEHTYAYGDRDIKDKEKQPKREREANIFPSKRMNKGHKAIHVSVLDFNYEEISAQPTFMFQTLEDKLRTKSTMMERIVNLINFIVNMSTSFNLG
jgi:hypothetical protein